MMAAYFRTRDSLSLTRRTNASVFLSRDSSGLVAPPGKELTRVVVALVVKFFSKIAYIPEWTSDNIDQLMRPRSETDENLCCIDMCRLSLTHFENRLNYLHHSR